MNRWMIIFCTKSCEACHLRDPKVRCAREQLNISTTPAYQPGDMNSMFSSIVSRFQDRYDINVISTSPWIVTFDNFISDQEVDSLLNSVTKFERSTDTGETNEYGETGRILSQGRTSTNAWCQRECEQNPDVKNMMRKIEEVTNIPRSHYESFQVKSIQYLL
jgi:prolyl 4-hydroxylase